MNNYYHNNYINSEGKLQRRKIKTGVLLMNIGSAKSEKENLKYLINMFTDRDIIQLPCQCILGRLIPLMIVNRSKRKHKLIGGYSHVPFWTGIQAEMLRQYLDYHSPETAPHVVFHCQRYSEPTSEEVIQNLLKMNVNFCVVIPLYPQYSVTSTLSSLRELDRTIDTYDSYGRIKWTVIQSFNSHPSYLKLIVGSIKDKLNEFPLDERNKVNIIFSAHSLPLSTIAKGDLYKAEIEKNIKHITSLLNLPNPIHLGWQSQEGKKWLTPKTEDIIKQIAHNEGYGCGNILVFPLSFVSDHIETLYDINIVQRNVANECGIKCFKRCESFNDDPKFIETLGDIFMDHVNKINKNIKMINKDDLDIILNLALVDNNIKRYIDGPTNYKRRKYHKESIITKSYFIFNIRNKIILISIIIIFLTMLFLSKNCFYN